MRGNAGANLTTGPITRTLLAFAVPTLLSNVLQSLNGSINAVWVGRFLGEDALAATSNANIIMFLMFATIFGFGMAATIIVGQNWGRGDRDMARRAIGTAVGTLFMLSLVVAVAGWLATPTLLSLMATPGHAMPLAAAYMRVIFAVMPASFVSVVLMMGLRGTGDSLTPLWFMGLSAVLDAGLNPVFILGLGPAPRLGIAGSAVATAIAGYASLAALLTYVYSRDLPLRLRGRELRYLVPDPALLRIILAKGLPMGLQMIVVSLSQISVIGIVNRQGVVTTAAYAVTTQLWTYVQMPALALGAAVSAMAAQNIGAGRWDRVQRVTRSGVWCNVVMTGVLVTVLTVIDAHALGLFLGANSPSLPIAQHIQRVASWGFVLFGVTFVLFGTVRANGAVYGPLVILFIALFPVRLGLMVSLLPYYGAEAIWWTIPISSLTSMLLSLAYYRWGKWRGGPLLTVTDPDEASEQSEGDAEPAGRMKPAG
ncbi:MATE family efflux transporter [Sphingomonas quercus]|uniref:MATE family efflux transporter n=1 Tax=Sphingomonas quercus TaxID=2842451 RepID=A0ABS6BFT2_9SPHN|nr:MATE family efflux transporter [Sphingomonas quercus]MBU3076341.1 MATE family efflux transporter [Sphingomonas quercus]